MSQTPEESVEESVNDQDSNDQSVGDQTVDAQDGSDQTAGGQDVDDQDVSDQTVDAPDSSNQMAGDQDVDNQDSNDQDITDQAVDELDSSDQSAGDQHVDDQDGNDQDITDQAVDELDSSDQSAGDQHVDDQDGNDQSVGDQDPDAQDSSDHDSGDQASKDEDVGELKDQAQSAQDVADQDIYDQYLDDQGIDQLEIKHSDGRTEPAPLPEGDGVVLRIGRELDNDIILVDPRSSRYHAELRRSGSILEIRDLGSANGTIVNETRLEPKIWTKIAPGQRVKLAETRLKWDQSIAGQATVAMTRQRATTRVSPIPPPAAGQPAPAPVASAARPRTTVLPWAMGLGAAILLILLIGIVLLIIFGRSDQSDQLATGSDQAASGAATPDPTGRDGEVSSLALQTPVGGPTPTPSPAGPQLAIPILEVEDVQVSPIIFGASPSTSSAYIFIDVRARNSGNIPFQFSISNFTLMTRDGESFAEAGSNTSENYLRQLGAIDRFEDLALTPGGSVPGSLVFELEIGTYDLELGFDVPDLAPIVLGLGSIDMARELNLAAGTPLAALAQGAVAEATPTLEPTPTPTRPALIPAPQVVPRSALSGKIAYPVFNGTDYDLYVGEVDGSGTEFFRAHASQPSFSPDGSRIAYHSWDSSARGLMTMDVSGANPIVVGGFVEDQLPVWSADGSEIIFLSRRTGDRKSQLYRVDSSTERSDGVVIGEGEYPSVGPQDQLVFKGWGNTAFGLRLAPIGVEEVQTVSNVEEDTAPILSPDGQKIAFMSRRAGNWDIYIINTDGSDLQRLTSSQAQDGLPAWSPDGNAIAFVSDRGGIWAIWVMTPDGKGHSQLFTMEGSPDGFVGTDTYASRGWAEERISWIE